MDYNNPNDAWHHKDNESRDPRNEMDDADRQAVIILRILKFLIVLMAAILIFGLLTGCAVPKAVEEHHHHHYEADTMAVKAQVDRHMQSWHEQMQSFVSSAVTQQLSQQQQSEQQHETVTETITESVDSLGRRIRQEQRTISRDMLNVQSSMFNSVTRAYEQRLQLTVDSIDSVWQSRYDALLTHWEQADSASVQKTPVGDARPWYRRWWDAIQYILIGAVLAASVWIIRKFFPWPGLK